MRFRLPAGERSGLPFSGTLRRFQILAQPLVLFLQLVSLPPHTAQFLHQFPNTADRIEILEQIMAQYGMLNRAS